MAKAFSIAKVNAIVIIKRVVVNNLRLVKADSSVIFKLKSSIHLKYWAKAVVSSFMCSSIRGLKPVSNAYVLGCKKRLKQYSTALNSVMQKSVVACATKRLSSSRIN